MSSPTSKASSAPPLLQVLVKIRAATDRLGALLHPALLENPPAMGTFAELERSVSRALSLADLEQRSPPGEKRRAATAGRRLSRRRRSSQPYSWRSISKTLEDGYTWRKYGQKEIQSARYPRSYFRCTHRNDQGCKAIRHVQVSEEDPSSFVITYLGEHTCGDSSVDLAGQLPSTVAAAAGPRLISFGSCGTVVEEEEAAAAAAASTAAPSPKQDFFDEEVISNLTTDVVSSPEDYFTAVPPGGGETDMELESLLAFVDFDVGGAGGCCFW